MEKGLGQGRASRDLQAEGWGSGFQTLAAWGGGGGGAQEGQAQGFRKD